MSNPIGKFAWFLGGTVVSAGVLLGVANLRHGSAASAQKMPTQSAPLPTERRVFPAR